MTGDGDARARRGARGRGARARRGALILPGGARRGALVRAPQRPCQPGGSVGAASLSALAVQIQPVTPALPTVPCQCPQAGAQAGTQAALARQCPDLRLRACAACRTLSPRLQITVSCHLEGWDALYSSVFQHFMFLESIFQYITRTHPDM